jgi:hypothetical protein
MSIILTATIGLINDSFDASPIAHLIKLINVSRLILNVMELASTSC